MAKRTKILISILLVALFVLGGCSTYTFTPLEGDTSYASVISNGGSVVQAGNYTYFVNGSVSYNVDNVYGQVVKGSVARVKTSTIGTDDELIEILAPKAVYYTSDNGIKGGLYIFNNRLYYTSISVSTDKEGSRQTSYLDIFSCKLNGSDTVLHYTLKSSTPSLMFKEAGGKVFVSYVNNKELFYVEVTASSPKEVSTDITDIDAFQYDALNSILYYSRTEYEEYKDTTGNKVTANYNKIYSYDKLEKDFTTTTKWDGSSSDPLSLVKATIVSAKEGNLIFSTTSVSGKTQTLLIKSGTATPVVISNETKTAAHFYKDYIYETTSVNGSTWIVKRSIGSNTYILLANYSGTIVKINDEWVYFTVGNILYRSVNAYNAPVKEYEKVTTSSMNSALGDYEFIGDRIFFIDSSHTISGYMYYVTITDDKIVKDEEDEILESRLAKLTEDDLEIEAE